MIRQCEAILAVENLKTKTLIEKNCLMKFVNSCMNKNIKILSKEKRNTTSPAF